MSGSNGSGIGGWFGNTLDWLGGNKNAEDNKSTWGNQSGTTTQNQTQTTNLNGAQQTQALDPQTLAALASAARTQSGNVSQFDFSAIRNELTRQFNEDTLGDINQNAQKYGSMDNSTTQLLINKGRSDLAAKLQAGAVQASTAASQSLAYIAQAAKGGQTNTSQQQSQQSVLDALTQMVQQSSSYTQDKSQESGSVWSDIGAII